MAFPVDYVIYETKTVAGLSISKLLKVYMDGNQAKPLNLFLSKTVAQILKLFGTNGPMVTL